MADALKLIEVAQDAGFQRRCAFMMMEHAETVVNAASPAAVDLAFAKLLFANGPRTYVEPFAIILVNGAAGTALEGMNYNHTSVPDATFSAAVVTHFSTFAKGIS